MADISRITMPNGVTYDIKDAVARNMATGISFVKCTMDTNTPIGVTWDDNGTTVIGKLVASALTIGDFYLVPQTTSSGKDIFAEYFTVKDQNVYAWEKIGTTDIDLSDLGTLAYKDSASGNYKPEGTISKPVFTGALTNINLIGTPSGSISVGVGEANYTPGGSVSAPVVTVTPRTATGYFAGSSTGGGSKTDGTPASCTLPTFQASVSDETLDISWTDGSFTANVPTQVTLPTFNSETIVTGIQQAEASAPTFIGNGVRLIFDGESMPVNGVIMPGGTVSQPIFTGTQKEVIVS